MSSSRELQPDAASSAAVGPSTTSGARQRGNLRRFFAMMDRGAALAAGVAGGVALALFGAVPAGLLTAWVAVVVAIAALRFVAARIVIRRYPAEDPPFPWGWVAVVLSFLQGSAWLPLLAATVLVSDPALVLLIGLVLGMLITGVVVMTGVYPPACWAYAGPLVMGSLAWLAVQADGQVLLAASLGVVLLCLLRLALDGGRRVRRDLEQRREIRDLAQRLGSERERFQATVASIGDAVVTADRQGLVTHMNAAAEQLLGCRMTQVRGQRLDAVVRLHDSADASRFPALLERCLVRGEPAEHEEDFRLLPLDGGAARLAQLALEPARDERGGQGGLVAVIRDVTRLRGMAQRLRRAGLVDPVTQLPNRRGFQKAVGLRLADAAETQSTLCWLALDRFQLVNDACGHAGGDAMLRHVAERLRRLVPTDSVLARAGGGAFALLLPDIGLAQAAGIATGLQEQVGQSRFTWQGRVYQPGMSVGVVPGPTAEDDIDARLAAADVACGLAREQGSDRIYVAGSDDQALANRYGEMEWAARTQDALDSRRLRLRFQRMQPTTDDLPVKVELLASVLTEDGRFVSPEEFLPGAERFDMMPAVDRRVVRMALEAIARGPQALEGVDQFAINLSGQSVNDTAFLGFVLEAIRETGVDPLALCFEITETAVISNLAQAREFMEVLRDQGCAFALDDFGSGVSSFGYLRQLPVDDLKIDGQFIRNLPADDINQSLVRAITQVGHTMGVHTVAEFVEDDATLAWVTALGVDYAQGYAVHRPELLQG